ncbi:hypothetical protein B0A55_12144 [Friedmanniomyces simplex]|uniref:Mid2 domain-containing protein n=1 Tax=Friedmanniomyces simplex TaxID=329884 RepID=A0A4U0W705_9PEZI|nr:hypothetical protein B0A55_12144 [Friedmanniomyces simplex]
MPRIYSYNNNGLQHAAIILILSLTAATRTASAQQTLRFTAPAANALTALGATTNYTLGEHVRVAWQSGFELTTLRVWQGPREDGSFGGRVLADETSFTWTAARVDNVPLSRTFHFELTNAEDGGCTGCVADSLDFYVTRPPTTTTSATSTSSSSSTSSTSYTSPPTTSASPSPSPTTDVAGSAATTLAPPVSHSNRHALALGLGLGLGLGIPFLLALLALCAVCLLRRRKNQRRSANLPRGHQPNISISAPLMVQQDKPAGLPGSLGHPQIAYFGAYTPGRRDEARVDRSSTGTVSSTAASSYHGPFEFERPGSEPRFDARSIEREIQSIPRSAPHYPPSGRASSVGSGSLQTGTPRSDYNPGGGSRLSSIDEHGPPLRAGTPEWPLRS